MPTVEILPINLFISKRYPAKQIEYDFGDTMLRDLIDKYDPRLNKDNAQIAIGNDIFNSWNVPIDSCLMYGDFIQLGTNFVPMVIRFQDKEVSFK